MDEEILSGAYFLTNKCVQAVLNSTLASEVLDTVSLAHSLEHFVVLVVVGETVFSKSL